jgi:hypothetical protein
MLPERRSTPRRRSRDRLPDRETNNPVLSQRVELRNLLLFLDDDVREASKALGRVERYLGRALGLLDAPEVETEALETLAGEQEIFDDLHALVDTLGSLRTRMGKVASTLKT